MEAKQLYIVSQRTEIAIRAFCVTQTAEKLKRGKVKGKHNANKTHFEVGRKVRQTIEELGGTMPEDLPSVESIKGSENKKRKKNDKEEGKNSKFQVLILIMSIS